MEALRQAGHQVTLLNRGRSDPLAYPDLEQLHGDRDPRLGDGVQQLRGREFDVAFDLSGYVPRVVRAACDVLAGRVGRYVFVSSISVYERFATGLDETASLAALADAASEDVMAHYGALKAECEREVAAVFGDRALLVRPGLIVGPFDPTGRALGRLSRARGALCQRWSQRRARGRTSLALRDVDAIRPHGEGAPARA